MIQQKGFQHFRLQANQNLFILSYQTGYQYQRNQKLFEPINLFNKEFNLVFIENSLCIHIVINQHMATFKAGKKVVNREQIVQQVRRQHVDRELFTLDYLNQSMNYITYDNQSLTNYLDTEISILDRLINEDAKKVGLHFVQRIKGMKQRCDQGIFLKDLQEYGDFVNYDLPKSHKKELLFIQSQLSQQCQLEVAAKRLKKRFPRIENRMTSRQISKLSTKYKEEILSSLINNMQMIPQEVQNNLQSNFLYRQLFNISDVMKEQNLEKQSLQKLSSQQGISSKIKAGYKTQKQSQNSDKFKSKKIVKVLKKNEAQLNENEEYIPKQSKKGGKQQQFPLIIDRPVLLNPQEQVIKNPRQPIAQSNSLMQVSSEFEKNEIKIVNSLSSQDVGKSRIIQNSESQLKKERANEEQNNASISVSSQKVKRKYTRAPKQPNQGEKLGNQKKSKLISKPEKEHKSKKQRERSIKKQDDQVKIKKQKKPQPLLDKKLEAEPLKAGQSQIPTIVAGTINKNEEIAYVSVSIQTGQNQIKNQNSQEIKQQIPHEESMPVIERRTNNFESSGIGQLKLQANHRQDNSMVPRLLGQSSSFQNANNSRRQVSRNLLDQSVSVSNPVPLQNPPQNEKKQVQKQQDISKYLA